MYWLISLLQLLKFVTSNSSNLKRDASAVGCHFVRITEEAAVDAIVCLYAKGTKWILHTWAMWCVSVFCSLVALAVWFLNLRTVHCRLLRLEEPLIGCGNTTHERFGTSCALSLSKFHLPFTEFWSLGLLYSCFQRTHSSLATYNNHWKCLLVSVLGLEMLLTHEITFCVSEVGKSWLMNGSVLQMLPWQVTEVNSLTP
jgi:hypothetical protein